MKKLIIVALVALLLFVYVQPAFAAASGFSLAQGEISGNFLENASLKEFFKNVKIEAIFSEQQQKYILSGTAEGKSGEYEMPDGSWGTYLGFDTGKGEISGEYDPLTGGLYGSLFFEAKYSGAYGKSAKITCTTSYVQAEFTGIANPGESSVSLTIAGKDLTPNKEVSFTATFAVQGTLPFRQELTEEPGETEEPEEIPNSMQEVLDSVKTPTKDSDTRFSDLSGQVEILLPLGYDENGKAVYDPEEPWQFAKLDMKLPVDTKIRTSENSSAMLSFADMTTFVMKPESIIVLSPPTAKDNQLKLLGGHLWTNVKKMLKDGSMDIEMSQAVAGIKGTTFVLEDDGETSTLKVLEGTVEYTSTATGKSVMVEAGETVSATADGLSEIKAFDIKAEIADWAEYGTKMPSEGFPLWAIIAIVGGALTVVLIVAIAVAASRKKRAATAATHPAYAQGAYPPLVQSSPTVLNAFCAQCGAPLAPGKAFCAKCGRKIGI